MGNNNSRQLQVPTDLEKYVNWYRLALSLEICVKPVLLDILHDPAHGGLPRDEATLHTALTIFKASPKGRTLSTRKILKDDQWDVLCHDCTVNACQNQCPRNGKTKSSDFDITLILILLINCTQLNPPQGGWFGNLQKNDNSIAANAVRAKQKRNKLSHTPMEKFSDDAIFKIHRADIRKILQGLGVNDFSKFDSLETKAFDKEEEETKTFLEDRKRFIKSAKWLKNKKVLLQELSSLKSQLYEMQLDVCKIKTTVKDIQKVVVNNSKTSLKFHLNLSKPSPFTFHEIKMNGQLHRHMMEKLKLLFQQSCGEISETFKILITKIEPLNEHKQYSDRTPIMRFVCEVKSQTNASYFQKNLENSLEPIPSEIIESIENTLVESIKQTLHINVCFAFVSKWEVGSLFLDIILTKLDSTDWKKSDVPILSANVNRILAEQFHKDVRDVTVNIKEVVHDDVCMEQIGMFGSVTMRASDIDTAIEYINKFDDNIFKHVTMPRNQEICTKEYKFDIKLAGMICGAKHSRINGLRQLPDIINISLDTLSSPTHCIVTVQALTQAACKKVYDILIKQTNTSRFAKFMSTLIESEENERQIVLIKHDENKKTLPVVVKKETEMYTLDRFRIENWQESFQRMSLSSDPYRKNKNHFHTYSIDLIKETFHNALKEIDFSTVQTIDFNIIPGKTIFVSRRQDPELVLYRCHDGSLSLVKDKLKPTYITLLNPFVKDEIFQNLKDNYFSCTNFDTPEAFTNVHLMVGEEKIRFSVRLALDENLNEIKEINDIRLSEDKKRAIERILKAETIGEVLHVEGKSRKFAFYTLSKLVHPDKNSHPGATEAFKKLNHAKKELIEKNKSSTNPALTFESSHKLVSPGKPPKVLSVRKNKTKICTITTFSQSMLDVRALFVTMETDNDALTQHVRDVLNNCWNNRDEHGGIQTPDGKTGIEIALIKQMTAGYNWVKEIETEIGSVFLEINVNELRVKFEYGTEWRDCIEIDMKLNVENRDYKNMSANDFTNDFLTIKEEWEKIRPTFLV